jgi:hypothetical protein
MAQTNEVFKKLNALVGEWESATAATKPHTVSYKLIANQTVLVETWELGNSSTAMTVYHLDSEKLIATHYCPLGNQPRLELISTAKEQIFTFAFVSATNLPDKNLSHQHKFEIQIKNADNFWRSETYLETGKESYEGVDYVRVK